MNNFKIILLKDEFKLICKRINCSNEDEFIRKITFNYYFIDDSTKNKTNLIDKPEFYTFYRDILNNNEKIKDFNEKHIKLNLICDESNDIFSNNKTNKNKKNNYNDCINKKYDDFIEKNLKINMKKKNNITVYENKENLSTQNIYIYLILIQINLKIAK